MKINNIILLCLPGMQAHYDKTYIENMYTSHISTLHYFSLWVKVVQSVFSEAQPTSEDAGLLITPPQSREDPLWWIAMEHCTSRTHILRMLSIPWQRWLMCWNQGGWSHWYVNFTSYLPFGMVFTPKTLKNNGLSISIDQT